MNTEKDLAFRLKKVMADKKISIQQLSDALGITYEMVRRYTLGTAKPREKNLANIAKYLSVSPMWLQFGEGSNVQAIEIEDTDIFSYPIISYVQAGLFTESCDFRDSEGYEELTSDLKTKGDGFFLRISGNSMEPKFSEGDLILVDTGLYPRPGNYVVAMTETGETTLKLYKEIGEISESGNLHFELIPLNELYPTFRSKTQEIRIIGVAVEHRSYL